MSDAAVIAPTPHRMAKSATWEVPGLHDREAGQHVRKTKRSAYKHVSLVEIMRDSDELEHEHEQAYAMYVGLWERSTREPYAQSRYGCTVVTSEDERRDRDGNPICPVASAVSARRRHQAATRAIGPHHSRVLQHVMHQQASRLSVGHLIGLKHKHTAIKRGKEAVHAALSSLAEHYGLIQTAPRPRYVLP